MESGGKFCFLCNWAIRDQPRVFFFFRSEIEGRKGVIASSEMNVLVYVLEVIYFYFEEMHVVQCNACVVALLRAPVVGAAVFLAMLLLFLPGTASFDRCSSHRGQLIYSW